MKIISFSDYHGAYEGLEDFERVIRKESPDLLLFIGDILKFGPRALEFASAREEKRVPDRDRAEVVADVATAAEEYRRFFEFLGGLDRFVAVIPGNLDAPRRQFMRAATEFEGEYNNLRVLHRLWAQVGDVAIAGFGGEISENVNEDYFMDIYPREAVLYCFKEMGYVDAPHKLFMIHTPPVARFGAVETHKLGSRIVNQVIERYGPELVLVAHDHKAKGQTNVGEAVVVNAGPFNEGNYAVIERLRPETTVSFRNLKRDR